MKTTAKAVIISYSFVWSVLHLDFAKGQQNMEEARVKVRILEMH